MSFSYSRTIRFADTDAAGVVYFANLLSICHEAYEASLMATGIELHTFFNNPRVAIPIVHANIDFFQPLFCGDEVAIALTPQSLSGDRFEIIYLIQAASMPTERPLAKARTEHVSIDPQPRIRQPLPPAMIHWIESWSD
ncbi:acyl-CoA thioesterase [Oscillatoria acuminata]|uniref:1,4-dihydroxy-2-naphthoyl-CoA hydrolase n=1 Tax=Oscillatoria acuminata PCC 6304 TaxID=56110 RepID=K9THQ1_9CYAN|nr:thioesterase family protein [Oscillatoria acuminata]AFY81554.1 putative thioesterase [Oscillatoria acuminata PCC 6304]